MGKIMAYTKKKPSMFGYQFDIKSECVAYDPPQERYGDWSKESVQTPDDFAYKINVGNKHVYPDIVSSIDIPVGETAYIVYVVWSDGDSFGYHRNGNAEAVAIFNNINDANDMLLYLNSINWKNEERVNFKTSDGSQHITQHSSWYGYFEKFSYADIKQVIIKGASHGK